jgi:hypothetical protein
LATDSDTSALLADLNSGVGIGMTVDVAVVSEDRGRTKVAARF